MYSRNVYSFESIDFYIHISNNIMVHKCPNQNEKLFNVQVILEQLYNTDFQHVIYEVYVFGANQQLPVYDCSTHARLTLVFVFVLVFVCSRRYPHVPCTAWLFQPKSTTNSEESCTRHSLSPLQQLSIEETPSFFCVFCLYVVFERCSQLRWRKLG